MPSVSEVLAKNVAALRRIRGLSQDDLGRAIGKSKQSIYEIETGNGWPRLDTVKKLAKALGVPETDLFYAGEPPKPVAQEVSLRDVAEYLKDLVAGIEASADDDPLILKLEKLLRPPKNPKK